MKDDKVPNDGPPLGLRWTYLRPYGAGDRYSLDMYRMDGSDSVYLLRRGEPDPYEVENDGTLDLNLGREEMAALRDELTWRLEHWGED